MSPEQFENKIKQALENHAPAYDNKAWEKMELLLDKHMPVKKDKDRRILFLLFFFLIAGGGAYIFLKNNAGKQETAATMQKVSGTTVSADKLNQTNPGNKNSVPENETIQTEKASETNNSNPETTIGHQQTTLTEKQAGSLSGSINASLSEPNKQVSKNKSNSIQLSPERKKNNLPEQGFNQNEINSNKEIFALNPPVNSKIEPNEITGNKGGTIKKDNPVHTDLQAYNKNISGKQKNNSSSPKGFFLSASTGADVSMVQTNEVGEVKLLYGFGLGYNINRRFALRTGFYKGDKVYSTNPDYYHPPSNFWSYYPNLKQVDASCKVYEVPLVADYSFGFRKNHSWFASAGLSSLFMKKEEYNYYYKPINSPDYIYKTRTIENENKHYFSILDLSGGYTGKLNNHFSLRAEPYFKVALTGIGYGNVKLNSGGLMISVLYKPSLSGK